MMHDMLMKKDFLKDLSKLILNIIEQHGFIWKM